MGTAGFVILHYGDRETTDACVRSVLKMKDQKRIRIIIVDNDIEKTEDQRRKLKEAYRDNSRITVLKVRSGGGFSQANNLGYRFAREKLQTSFIIVLNNDIEFTQEDFIGRMERSFRENPCHVLGPDVVRAGTGEHQNPLDTRIRTAEEAAYTVRMNRMALRLYPVAWPVILRKLKKEEEKLRQKKAGEGFCREVQKDIVPFGACLIFTPEFVKREELAFDPETQFFYEEYILAYRCRKKGYHTVFDPSLKVLHESGAATVKTFRSEKKRLKFMLERTAEAAQIYHTMITGG